MAGPLSSKSITTQDRRIMEAVRDREERISEMREMMKCAISPHRPAHEILEDGAWRGERCFIIGGGPSLSGFDFERLRGKGRIIATNKSYLDVPFADILFFMDGSKTSFYGLVKSGRLASGCLEKWKAFQGHKVFLNIVGRKYDDVYSIRALGRVGLSMSLKKGLYHGNNSGAGALGLAICLRANPIYLLGIDGKFEGGKSHYHGGYPSKHPESVYKSFVGQFEKAGRLIAQKGFKVVNLNPGSAVRCFPFSTIEEVLGNGKAG